MKVGDRLPDALPSNSGAKAFDGMTGGKINKIMLDEAIGKLPRDLRRVVFLRWTGPKVRLRKALGILGYGKSEYYRRCDIAVDRIYRHVNGLALNYSDLYDSIH